MGMSTTEREFEGPAIQVYDIDEGWISWPIDPSAHEGEDAGDG